MKKNNKKGFTIVELVIVIAVIGILAAVLIPTFGGIIADANEKAALQDVRSAYTQYLATEYEAGRTPKTTIYVVHTNETIVKIDNGAATVVDSEPSNYTRMYIKNGTLSESDT